LGELDDLDRAVERRLADLLVLRGEVRRRVRPDDAVHPRLDEEHLGADVLAEAAGDAALLDPDLADATHRGAGSVGRRPPAATARRSQRPAGSVSFAPMTETSWCVFRSLARLAGRPAAVACVAAGLSLSAAPLSAQTEGAERAAAAPAPDAPTPNPATVPAERSGGGRPRHAEAAAK